jgi:uncharacterized protein (DUF488 family)
MTLQSQPGTAPLTIYTIGHGNRPSVELIDLLHEAHVARLVDVRAHPGSRRHPQFSQSALAHELPAAQIRYLWEGQALGGRRRLHAGSPHCALRNESFRAYADHMTTDEFVATMARLIGESAHDTTAIMCAERLPWRCHRYLIADYLVAHGVRVIHLIAVGSAREHTLHPVARVAGGLLIYDKLEQLEFGLSENSS